MTALLDFLQGQPPVAQALFGTLFTWLMTAIGAAAIFLSREPSRKLQDGMLGFAAGVMIAASYWSLLAPAIELSNGSWIPAVVGFLLGGAFLPCCCDALLGFGDLLPQLADQGCLGQQLAIPGFQLVDQGVELVDVGVGGLADHGQVGGEQGFEAADGGLGRAIRHQQDVADLAGEGVQGETGRLAGVQRGHGWSSGIAKAPLAAGRVISS